MHMSWTVGNICPWSPQSHDMMCGQAIHVRCYALYYPFPKGPPLSQMSSNHDTESLSEPRSGRADCLSLIRTCRLLDTWCALCTWCIHVHACSLVFYVDLVITCTCTCSSRLDAAAGQVDSSIADPLLTESLLQSAYVCVMHPCA